MRREEAHRPDIEAGKHPWLLHGCEDNYRKLDVEEIDAAWRP